MSNFSMENIINTKSDNLTKTTHENLKKLLEQLSSNSKSPEDNQKTNQLKSTRGHCKYVNSFFGLG